MSWEVTNDFITVGSSQEGQLTRSLDINQHCFIRKSHKCGKIFGASMSCFIACPTEDNIEPILELMSEKLSKVGVEPIIAVKERAYGQDIFCTKICGKIIESLFCIVILDDKICNKTNIPNSNVYYEYGLMTSLRKHIIPLQKDDLQLAFNIQSYDTIKYNYKNIGSELDRAIKDAIKLSKDSSKEEKTTYYSDRSVSRNLELAGLLVRDKNWYLWDVIEDTIFKGFGQYDKHFYLYLGKIDSVSDFQTNLEDLGIILHRTEIKAKELIKITNGHKQDYEDIKNKIDVVSPYLKKDLTVAEHNVKSYH